MKKLLTCPSCNHLFSVEDSKRNTKCPSCKSSYNISESGSLTPDRLVNISEFTSHREDGKFVNISE